MPILASCALGADLSFTYVRQCQSSWIMGAEQSVPVFNVCFGGAEPGVQPPPCSCQGQELLCCQAAGLRAACEPESRWKQAALPERCRSRCAYLDSTTAPLCLLYCALQSPAPFILDYASTALHTVCSHPCSTAHCVSPPMQHCTLCVHIHAAWVAALQHVPCHSLQGSLPMASIPSFFLLLEMSVGSVHHDLLQRGMSI